MGAKREGRELGGRKRGAEIRASSFAEKRNVARSTYNTEGGPYVAGEESNNIKGG